VAWAKTHVDKFRAGIWIPLPLKNLTHLVLIQARIAYPNFVVSKKIVLNMQ